MHKTFIKTGLILALVIYMIATASSVFAGQMEYKTIHMKGSVRYIAADGTYGILGEDKKKYLPVRLAKEYRRDGIAVVFDAKLRPDLIGTRMWGTAVEIIQIMSLEQYVSKAEEEAIQSLLFRMSAFENHDFEKLQKIDIISRKLSQEDFESWLGFYGKYTLRYVEITEAGPDTIQGMCLYSRELVNAMALSGNVKRTVLCFTLSKLDGEWKFTGTSSYQPSDPNFDLEQFIADMEAQGMRKYGTDNLAQRKTKQG